MLVRRAVKFQKRCWLILGPSSRLTSVLDVGRGWCLWARAHCILLRKQHLAFAIRPLMHQQNHTLPSQHKLYRPLLRQETRHLRTTLPHLRAMQDTRSLRAGGALTRCSARANIATRDWGRDMGVSLFSVGAVTLGEETQGQGQGGSGLGHAFSAFLSACWAEAKRGKVTRAHGSHGVIAASPHLVQTPSRNLCGSKLGRTA